MNNNKALNKKEVIYIDVSKRKLGFFVISLLALFFVVSIYLENKSLIMSSLALGAIYFIVVSDV